MAGEWPDCHTASHSPRKIAVRLVIRLEGSLECEQTMALDGTGDAIRSSFIQLLRCKGVELFYFLEEQLFIFCDSVILLLRCLGGWWPKKSFGLG